MVTVKTLRSLKAKVWLSDGGGRGAGSLVFRRTGDGVIRAYFRHIQSDGKRYALPFAQYDESGRNGLTLAQARERAGELSKLYQSGVRDIRRHLEAEQAERRATEEAERAAREAALAAADVKHRCTLAALCRVYADGLERGGKIKSAKDARSAFKVHVLESHSALARKPAREVTPHDVAAIIRQVREAGKERTAGVLRSYLRAAYAMAIRAPFDSAVPSELIAFGVDMNPVDAIPAIPVRAGRRTLSTDELRRYLQALTAELPDQALRLALYSGGQRMSQLLRACVADYDTEGNILRLWDGKGKRREPREHLVPLASESSALVTRLIERAKMEAVRHAESLAQAPDPNPSLWLSTPGTIMDHATPGKRLAHIAAMMQVESFNLRDMRRTVETMLAGMGISRETRAQLLSHGLSGVQAVHYDRHSYIPEKREALIAWETRLNSIIRDVASA